MDKGKLKDAIRQAIERGPLKKEVKKLSLFGSFLSGHEREDSDIDILVEFLPKAKIGFFKFIDLQENLEKAAGRKVDLLTPEALSRHFKDSVLQNTEVIYER